MTRPTLRYIITNVPYFLALCSVGVLIGNLIFGLSILLLIVPLDLIIVTFVLLVVGVMSTWNNPRCLPLSFRRVLLDALAGKDMLIANGKININRSCIYVEQDTDLVVTNTHINYNEDYAIRFEIGCEGTFNNVELISYNQNNRCALKTVV